MTSRRSWLYVGVATIAFLGIELSGCAGKRISHSDVDVIHLHAGTLSRRDRTTIRNSLAAEGFTIKLRDNPSPFEANTLIYHPFAGFEHQLERIRLALDNTDYAVDNLHVRQARNHHYTPGHVGLYLKSKRTETPGDAEVLPEIPFNLTDFEFVSSGCESTYILEFYHDETVAVLDTYGDDPLVTLRWTDTEEKVALKSDSTTYRYKKSLGTNRDGTKTVFSILLVPEDGNSGLYGCEYLGRTIAHRLNR